MHNITAVPSSSNVVFYPIGNTPAVNLLAYCSPANNKDAVTEILLLACGDPRSILYSLWCEGRPGAEKFNFTCCDLEPGVLARNVLLLSLMIDNAEVYNSKHYEYQDPRTAAVWNLCYHFYVPKQNLEVLQEQASKLLSCSETPGSWAKSSYAAIKFVSLQTVNELRKIWLQYTEQRSKADQAKWETRRRSDIKKTYDKIYGQGGETLSFSAGPHWDRGLSTANVALRGYWKTGVVAGNSTDLEQLESGNKGCVNSMFIVSSVSESFAVHYASDPLSSFHIASAFDGPDNEAEDINKMVFMAKTQFMEWSKAFVEYARCGSTSVNIYFGDAVSFCHELGARNPSTSISSVLTRLYTSQWSAKPLRLDGDGAPSLPTTFDVIDTSNLADWIGFHNLLPATTPLLSPKSTSILYTETLRLSAQEPGDELTESLFMSVDMASLIIGLAPTGHLLGYTTENSHAEDMVHLEPDSRRYRMRIPWRVAALGDRHIRQAISCREQPGQVRFEADELAELFFSIYLKMFKQEDIKKMMQTDLSPENLRTLRSDFNRYSRLSFSMLLQQTKRNIQTDWDKVFSHLREKINGDETLHIGHKTGLDLNFQNHINGVCEDDIFTKNIVTKAILPRAYAFVTLVVPRQRLKIFDKLGGAPGVHLAIIQDEGDESLFFSLDCFFGTIGPSEDQDTCGPITEDPTGWAGSSDLILTCLVPEMMISMYKKWYLALKVTMCMDAVEYVHRLGMDLTVYKASVNDKKHVITSNCPPGIHPSRLEAVKSNAPSKNLAALSLENGKDVVLGASHSKGRVTLRATYTIAKDSEESKALASGAIITLTDLSPCSILLQIGSEHSHRLLFPYPINGSKAMTRIARKSLWIEVKVPLASATDSGGYDLEPFPVIAGSSPQPSAWPLPRINLPQQPPVATANAPWLKKALGQVLSSREKDILEQDSRSKSKSTTFLSTLPYLKETLFNMMLQTAGQHESKPTAPNKIFILAWTDPSGAMGNSDTLIVASALRHTREHGNLVLDGWFIPMTLARRDEIFAVLPKTPGMAVVFTLREGETALWKRMLPAAAESCRVGWEHGAECAYVGAGAGGKVPVSMVAGESSVCGCGEGRDVEGFPEEFLGPFKGFATRVALTALAGVAYVEAMDPGV